MSWSGPPPALRARRATPGRGTQQQALDSLDPPSVALVDRGRLAEEAVQDVIGDPVVLLLEARVRDTGHDGELLVRVRQPREEVHQVFEAGDAVVLTAHDDRRRGDARRIYHGEVFAHVDVGPGRHRVVQRQD